MRAAALAMTLLAFAACDKSSSEPSPAPNLTQSGGFTPPAPPPTGDVPSPLSPPGLGSASASSAPAAGPNDLTDARRAKIESTIPDAKGFVDVRDLGRSLIDDPAFNKAFADALTKKSSEGYLLFRGTMNDLQKDSFTLAMMIAEVDPNSMMGAPEVVTFRATGVKGYDPSKYKAGDYGAILGKFAGGAKLEIKSGIDLASQSAW